ncbi:MAG: xanthine dehydrogenase family protein subunit M [Alphaproteobacteria bacterium]|nr:xanthine dehydrogenase family protein subunit M [Alphaproteobacteria bacterium]
MYEFEYHRAGSVGEAADLLGKASDGRYLAGGMSLVPTMKLRLARLSDVVDLNGVDGLAGVATEAGTVTVGAMARHEAVADAPAVREAIPALAALAGGIGDPHVRHRGTLGGSICNNDPAADYPAAVLGLGATIHTDRREIAADDFFTGLFETALEEGEIVTKVAFPAPDAACYVKFPNPASRFAIVGSFVSRKDGDVRVAITGAGPCVFRVAEMEAALRSDFSADAVAGIKVSPDGLNSDIHGSAEYRAHLVTVLSKRAVAGCG